MKQKAWTRIHLTLAKGLGLVALLTILSCGGGLSGKYVSEAGISLEFEKNGKVLMGTTVFGMTNVVEIDYKVEGRNLKLIPVPGQAALVYKILDDGSIEGPLGIRLVKEN